MTAKLMVRGVSRAVVPCAIGMATCLTSGDLLAEPVTSITHAGVTWTFDQPTESGRYANGDHWVVGPVTIASVSPDYDGSHHGMEVNPMPGGNQGYDTRVNGFDAGIVPTLPYEAQPGESLIKAVSLDLPDTGCRPCLDTASVLTVLEQAPPDGGVSLFRPPYVGTTKTSYSVDDLRTDLLPSLAAPADTPGIADVAARFAGVQLDHKLGWSGRHMHPASHMPDYGSDIAVRNATGALRLMLEDSVEDKTPLLVTYVQMGIDWYGILANGGSWPGNGGHLEGRKLDLIRKVRVPKKTGDRRSLGVEIRRLE